MKYMGSKRRVAKHLLPIMLAERGDRVWVEPFVGGANMIDKVRGPRIGNDSHRYLIALLKAVRDGWVPPTEVSEELYRDVKSCPENYADEMVGFVGFLCSFGGKEWGGFARSKTSRNYTAESSRHMIKQAEALKGIDFRCGDYRSMEIPTNSLIYCDPPYAETTKYKGTNAFDHEEFWQWCRDETREGHLVFVSEYNAPEDFECLIEVQTKTSMKKEGSHSKRTEKLFRLRETNNKEAKEMEVRLVLPNSFVRHLAEEIAREMEKKPCQCKMEGREDEENKKEERRLREAEKADLALLKELNEKERKKKAEPKAEPKAEASCAITLEQMMHAAKEAAKRIGGGGPVQVLIKKHAEGEGKLKDVPAENYVKLLEALDELVTMGGSTDAG